MGGVSSSSNGSASYEDNRCRALMSYDDYCGQQARTHHSSDFCDPQSLVDHLQPGDMVQKKGNWVIKFFYSHFAVFVGNGDVIHVVGSGPAQRGALVDVFRGELVRKNNTHDGVMPPQPYRHIVLNARGWLNEHWDYHPVTNNCEHFATLCRYGRRISLQILGIGDVVAGRVSMSEYLYQNVVRSVKQACSTFVSWAKRKVASNFLSLTSGVAGLLGIEF